MYNFSGFEHSNESSPNFSCHFWNHKVRVYSNFPSLFSDVKDSHSVFFLAQTSHTLDKYNLSKWIFGLLSSWVKIHQILQVTFKPRVSYSSKFASHFIVMKHNSSVCFHLNLYMLCTKASNQSANFQTFDWSHEN